MPDAALHLREHARSIWDAAVAAADPFELVRAALTGSELRRAVDRAGRILVVGGGKAGAAMAAGVEAALADRLDRVAGVVNVPAGAVRPLRAIRLHAGRPAGINHPTAEGVAGVRDMLDLVNDGGAGRRRPVPAVRRRLRPAAGAGRGRVAGGQAARHRPAARLRRDHRRDELRPQAPLRASRAAGWPRRSRSAAARSSASSSPT